MLRRKGGLYPNGGIPARQCNLLSKLAGTAFYKQWNVVSIRLVKGAFSVRDARQTLSGFRSTRARNRLTP
jgi:hypothetical protein